VQQPSHPGLVHPVADAAAHDGLVLVQPVKQLSGFCE
jgi:hypothetical protein